jgi:protein TonB
MRFIDPALAKALVLSLLLHALLFAAGNWLEPPGRRPAQATRVQIDVTLRTDEALAPRQPRLFLDEATQPPARAPARVRPPHEPSGHAAHSANAPGAAFAAESASFLAGAAMQRANAQMARELLYPPEAIARGLEGQALVLLFLDASGNAIAARLESSSGYALLDDAAVRAARTLRALPDSAPREALLPVRFRLR